MNNATDFIGTRVHVKIDRPIGSKHPKYGFQYLLNYGFIPGVLGKDNEELDAYVLGIKEPIQEFDGICIAVINRTNDSDDKLIVVENVNNISDKEIEANVSFQERYFKHLLIRDKTPLPVVKR